MKQHEIEAARSAGLLSATLDDTFCTHVDSLIEYLEGVAERSSSWKFWLILGFHAAIAALKALRSARCSDNPFHSSSARRAP